MRSLQLVITGLFLFALQAQSKSVHTSIITDPTIGKRCQRMLEERQQKLQHKNKILSLIHRNKKLHEEIDKNDQALRKMLLRNQRALDQELSLSTLSLENLTEDLIRKGCPGVRL